MSSRKKGKASLQDIRKIKFLSFDRDSALIVASTLNKYLLKSSEFFIEEVNNHSTEHKAGEYGEKASNACKCPDDKKM